MKQHEYRISFFSNLNSNVLKTWQSRFGVLLKFREMFKMPHYVFMVWMTVEETSIIINIAIKLFLPENNASKNMEVTKIRNVHLILSLGICQELIFLNNKKQQSNNNYYYFLYIFFHFVINVQRSNARISCVTF